jgi:hypothetical protein
LAAKFCDFGRLGETLPYRIPTYLAHNSHYVKWRVAV